MAAMGDALTSVAGASKAGGADAQAQDSPSSALNGAIELESQKDNIAQLSEISKNSQTTFLAVVLVCVYSFLTIATTTDAALLSNSNATALPLLQANVPVVWFYYVAPAILTVLFVYFHLYLEGFWRGLARLPLQHPDGRGLDDYIYPWLISCALIRGQIRALSRTGRIAAQLEAWVSLLLGWGLVPFVLLFYWARYVVVHDWLGTGLHVALIVLSFGVGLTFLFVAHNALAQIDTEAHATAATSSSRNPAVSGKQRAIVLVATMLLAAVLFYLSAAAFYRPTAADCEQSTPATNCRLFAPAAAIWRLTLRQEPHAEVREVRFVARPPNWLQLVEDPLALRTYLDGQPTLAVSRKDLRHIRASGAFLPGSRLVGTNLNRAELTHADFTASHLTEVSLRGADLTGAIFRHAEVASSHLEQVSAVASRFDNSALIGAEREPTLMSGDFSNASFVNSEVQRLQVVSVDNGATPSKFIGAKLQGTRLGFASFFMVDFSDAQVENVHVDHGEFVEADFSGTEIRDTRFNFSRFTRCRFSKTRMDQVFFEEAHFIASELGNSRADAAAVDAGRDPVAPTRDVATAFHATFSTFDGNTSLINLEFRGADFRDSRFTRTQLTNVFFNNADLSSTYFDGVDFASVTFAGVDLSGADLSGSRGLSASLLAGACGNRETRLPSGLRVAPCSFGVRP